MSKSRSAAQPVPVYTVEAAPSGGHAIRRNDRYLMTPAGKAFVLPTLALTEAIAEEWRRQGSGEHGKPNHAAMPLNQLASTALDIVPGKRETIVDDLTRYAESDLLSHYAAEPPALVQRQRAAWQPLLDWADKAYDAQLNTGAGIMPIAQDAVAIAALRRVIEAADDFSLAGLQQAVSVAGSLIIGLALKTGRIDAGQAFETAETDTTFQIEKWGDDPASTARRDGVKKDLAVCERWFSLLK